MNKLAISFIVLLAFAACNSSRSVSKNTHPEFVGIKVFKQQSFPGVESELWFTMSYRVEFDLKTNSKTTFTHLIVNEDSIPIHLVMAGRFVQKEGGGKSLFTDTEKASVTADVQINRNDSDEIKKTHSPKSSSAVSLAYIFNEQNLNVPITEIIVEETISHP